MLKNTQLHKFNLISRCMCHYIGFNWRNMILLSHIMFCSEYTLLSRIEFCREYALFDSEFYSEKKQICIRSKIASNSISLLCIISVNTLPSFWVSALNRHVGSPVQCGQQVWPHAKANRRWRRELPRGSPPPPCQELRHLQLFDRHVLRHRVGDGNETE